MVQSFKNIILNWQSDHDMYELKHKGNLSDNPCWRSGSNSNPLAWHSKYPFLHMHARGVTLPREAPHYNPIFSTLYKNTLGPSYFTNDKCNKHTQTYIHMITWELVFSAIFYLYLVLDGCTQIFISTLKVIGRQTSWMTKRRWVLFRICILHRL